MKKFYFYILFICGLTILPAYCDSFPAGEAVKQLKHDFWIKFNENGSSLDFEIAQLELLNGRLDNKTPSVKIAGNLILKSRLSVSRCQVKLPSNTITASNGKGESITLQLRGSIGEFPLTTEFITPIFNEYNEVPFLLEAYVDPTTFKEGLNAGDYDYKSSLRLVIEFKD